MWDSNTDSKNGVSVWGHMLDGAATGAAGGALFGGIGAIPGAVGGGLLGLANGLWESHEESTARDTWMAARHDDGTVNRCMSEMDRIQGDPSQKGLSQDDAIQQAANSVFLQDRAVQEQANGTSWFDSLF